MALVYQQDLVLRHSLKAGSPQLPHLQVPIMWDPNLGVVLVLDRSPHLDRVLKDGSSCLLTQDFLSYPNSPDSGNLIEVNLQTAAVHECIEGGQNLEQDK